MRILGKDSSGALQIMLNWDDVESLKKGSTVSERYDGQHKINISVVPETLAVENWTETEGVPSSARFDEHLHDFFISLSAFVVRNAFLPVYEVEIEENPYYKVARFFYPT